MKLYVRLILLVLALMMALPLLVACNNTNPNDTESTEPDETEEVTVPENEENPNIPAMSVGREVSILARVYGKDYTYQYTEVEDSGESEPVNEAVVERNYFIEEKYDVIITPVIKNPSEIVPNLETSIMGNSSYTYDIVMPMMSNAMQAAARGFLVEWDRIPYVDQNKSYWMTHIFETTSLGGYHFFAPGDTNLSAYNTAQVAFFNKEMHKDLGLDNIYDLVKQDQWTVEKMMEMCAVAGTDVTGDGTGTLDDIYGVISATMIWQPLFYNSGIKIITKDQNDLPSLSGFSDNSAQLYDVIEDIVELTNTHNAGGVTNALGLSGNEKFTSDGALFWIECIYGQFKVKDMESDYGIVPVPVWNEGDEYYTNIHTNFSSVTCVPTNVMSLEFSGALAEDMAYYSQQMVIPVYYEQTIRLRGVRDDESYEMLDYIYDNVSTDLALVFSGMTIDSVIRDLIATNSSDVIVSTMQQNLPTFKDIMDTITTAFCNEGAKQYGLIQ